MKFRLAFAVTCGAFTGCAALAPPTEQPSDPGASVPPAKPPRKPAPDADHGPDSKGCDGIDAWGTCRDNVVLRCDAGVLLSTTCVAPLSRCALIDDVEGHGCVAPEDAPLEPPPEVPSDPGAPDAGCGAIDYLGTCEGDVVVFCDQGTLARVDCAQWNQFCGFVSAETGWYCTETPSPAPPDVEPPPEGEPDAPPAPPAPDVSPDPDPAPAPPSDTPAPPSGAPAPPTDAPTPPDAPADDPCDGLDYLGRCQGDVAEWCENGAIQTRDCRTVDGTDCGWVSAELGWYCGGEPSPPPDEPVAPEPPPAPDPPADDPPGPTPAGECYVEDWHPDASLAPAQNLLRGDWQAAAVEAMRLRWPAGHALLQAGAMEDLRSFGEGGSMSALAESMMTVIHEGTHGWDYAHASGNRTFAYFLRGDLTLEIPWIDGFPRSEIAADLPDDSTRTYAGTYLSGQQGARGFVELMDEGNCYINGMIALTVLGDVFAGGGISARDGAVAFLLYTQLYLRRARLQHPEVYTALQNDAQVRRLVDLQWRRAHYWLTISDQYPALGISDVRIRPHLYTPENLGELNRFLGLTLSASNCR